VDVSSFTFTLRVCEGIRDFLLVQQHQMIVNSFTFP
jgi:hypothetical protein